MRWLALSLAAALFPLLLVPLAGHGAVPGCPLAERLLYPFLHASLLHCAVNAWCLLGLVFYYSPALWQFAAALAIAVAVPDACLSPIPTVGLSGACFALMGIVSLAVARRMLFLSSVALCLAAGFIVQGVNPYVHVYCYVAGWLVGFFTTPIKWTR